MTVFPILPHRCIFDIFCCLQAGARQHLYAIDVVYLILRTYYIASCINQTQDRCINQTQDRCINQTQDRCINQTQDRCVINTYSKQGRVFTFKLPSAVSRSLLQDPQKCSLIEVIKPI